MHTLPKTELDCAVELDSHEHRVLHYLSRRMKGRHHLADYDMVAFAKHTNQATQPELVWALQRLQGYGLLEKVADGKVKVLFPCTCVSGPGMYDRNPPPPEMPEPCEVGPDMDLYGDLIPVDFAAGRKLTAEEVAAQKDPLTRAKGSLTGTRLTKRVRSERSPSGDASGRSSGPSEEPNRSGSGLRSSQGGMEKSVSSQNDMAASGDMDWTAYRLATYFADQCRLHCWGKSAQPVNQKALAKCISEWRKAGTKDAAIVAAIDTFVGRAKASPRKRESLWRTFASQIDALLAQQGTGTGSDRGESMRYDEAAWTALPDTNKEWTL